MKPGRIPGGMNMNALMKQAQKMQADMQKKQAELELREYTAPPAAVPCLLPSRTSRSRI